MDHMGPFYFNALRFALGALALAPLLATAAARRSLDRRLLPGALLAGTALFAGASLQQIGLVETTAGKAGFITGLYVVLVPLAGLLAGRSSGRNTWIGSALALTGLYLLSFDSQALRLAPGDGLVLLGAFFWTAHVLLIDRLASRFHWAPLACAQFAVCALLSLGAALARETTSAGAVLDAAGPLLYGGLLSVGVAYTLQVIGQRRAPPGHAAIILSLEAVFAVAGGWMLLDETLDARSLAGCGAMLAGMLVSQRQKKTPRGAD